MTGSFAFNNHYFLSSDRIKLFCEGLALFRHFLFMLFKEKSEFKLLIHGNNENNIIFTVD